MPEYEYFCRDCRHGFARFMSMKEHEKSPPDCPKCHAHKAVEKRLASVNVQTSHKA